MDFLSYISLGATLDLQRFSYMSEVALPASPFPLPTLAVVLKRTRNSVKSKKHIPNTPNTPKR